jgi:hypothetical protein
MNGSKTSTIPSFSELRIGFVFVYPSRAKVPDVGDGQFAHIRRGVRITSRSLAPSLQWALIYAGTMLEREISKDRIVVLFQSLVISMRLAVLS